MTAPIKEIAGRTVCFPAENVDTDQIIPARFLVATGREGIGAHLFADRRFDASGAPRADFPLNDPAAKGSSILVAGRNFGCGSSREHAAWALRDHGFEAVVSTSFADIFATNALKNGLVPVVVDEATHRRLLDQPGARVVVDVAAQTLVLADGSTCSFPLAPFARFSLLHGLDELGFLLQNEKAIAEFETRRKRLGG